MTGKKKNSDRTLERLIDNKFVDCEKRLKKQYDEHMVKHFHINRRSVNALISVLVGLGSLGWIYLCIKAAVTSGHWTGLLMSFIASLIGVVFLIMAMFNIDWFDYDG